MEHFHLEEPTILRKEDAIQYVKEHVQDGSAINGCGSLDRYVDDYEGWLIKLELDKSENPPEGRVPGRTYFLVREEDDRIVGIVNIRMRLNESLKEHGGHIGYGIRPSERRKGYNKINLYLALQICDQFGLEEVQLDAKKENVASWKTMEALGGEKVNEHLHNGVVNVQYIIPVKQSLEKYRDVYAECINSVRNR